MCKTGKYTFTHHSKAALVRGLAIAAIVGGCFSANLAQAKPAEVRAIAESELRFGTFMVFGSGTRSISAAGMITDFSIVPLEGISPSPARFTISYDRGNESKNTLTIELEVVLSETPQLRDGGVEGRLSSFQTDLPGAQNIAPGQAIRLTMANCRTRVCSRSFNVGARLDVTRHFGGASLAIPIPIDVAVISVDRQGR